MNTSNTLTNTQKAVDIIDGTFSVSEARDILNGVLDVKINFHKIQVISRKEGNHADLCPYDTSRLNKLVAEKIATKAFLDEMRGSGKKLRIKGDIQIEITD